jgi:hypothetical protein
VEVPDAVASGSTLQISASHPDGISGIVLYDAGVEVASSSSDTLSYTVGAAAGSTLDLLAVATATNAMRTVSDWPVDEHRPRPDIQGWTAASVLVQALPGLDAPDSGGGSGGGRADAACGCATGPALGGLGAWLLPVVWMRRRAA